MKKFVLVRRDGVKGTGQAFSVVPSSWMLSPDVCYFPKERMSDCAMEELVEKAEKAVPSKLYKRQGVKQIHDSGMLLSFSEFCTLCMCTAIGIM